MTKDKTVSEIVTEYREYQILKEELEAKLDELKTVIVEVMGELNEMAVGTFKVRNQTVKSNRLDTTALKNELPDIAKRFTRESEYKRFSIA